MSSPSSSPMAKPPSMLNVKKKVSSPSMSITGKSASEALAAVFQKHVERAMSPGSPVSSTPSLSYPSTTATTSTDESDLDALDEELPGGGSDGHHIHGLSYPPGHAAPTSEHAAATTRHSEFGHCTNETYRYVSRHHPSSPIHIQEQDAPYALLFTTYLSYLALIVFGHIRDFFGKIFAPQHYIHLMSSNGYAALNSDFDSFYTRRLKKRLDDCFSRPITGVPGRTVLLLDRQSNDYNNKFEFTGSRTRALNVSSYNYLGFAQGRGGCADAVEESIKRYGISALGSRLEGGTLDLHLQAEGLVARFLGQEDALITSMGFATNSSNIPALVSKGCLVISDELNHASIRFGVRLSGASVRMFKHNDMADLERLLRDVISQGQPRTHRPWKKILLVIEGLYSMEGSMCNLPAVLELKKRYKFYLWVDEAHSIGALGPHGRGVTDFYGVDPRQVDVLMGTFTKSFGAAGGYIAGSKAIISQMRLRSHASMYAESIAPAVLTQIIASMSSIMGVEISPSPSTSASSSSSGMTVMHGNGVLETYDHPGPAPSHALPTWLLSTLPPPLLSGMEGQARLRRLAFNCRYLARGLKKLGFLTYGHASSPIVPLLLFCPAKMPAFSRFMLQRSTPIVVVVVGYPATPLVESRVRFCISASHTKEDIDLLMEACDEIGDWLDLKKGLPVGKRWSLEEVKRKAVELVEMP